MSTFADWTISRAVIRDNLRVGVYLEAVTADLRESVISGVSGGHSQASNIASSDEEFGDCLLVRSSNFVDVLDTRLTGCAGAGVLYTDSAGQLSQVRSSENRFGLVVQGAPQPTWADDCAFEGTEHDTVTDGDLSVPNALPALP